MDRLDNIIYNCMDNERLALNDETFLNSRIQVYRYKPETLSEADRYCNYMYHLQRQFFWDFSHEEQSMIDNHLADVEEFHFRELKKKLGIPEERGIENLSKKSKKKG